MKNMALRELWLVKPKQFPDPEATARASGADDVLAAARVVDSVEEALAGCGYVAATTSRDRDQNFRVLDVRAAAQRLVLEARTAPAAVLFGAERTGLQNEHLEAAHALIRIPANPEYLSLNIAMAVQLVAYELFRAFEEPVVPDLRSAPLATPVEMERLYTHLAQVMEEVEFRDRTQSGTSLMARIRRFLQRAELDANEANILRGFLTSIQKRRRRAGSGNVGGEAAAGASSAVVDASSAAGPVPGAANLPSGAATQPVSASGPAAAGARDKSS